MRSRRALLAVVLAIVAVGVWLAFITVLISGTWSH